MSQVRTGERDNESISQFLLLIWERESLANFPSFPNPPQSPTILRCLSLSLSFSPTVAILPLQLLVDGEEEEEEEEEKEEEEEEERGGGGEKKEV